MEDMDIEEVTMQLHKQGIKINHKVVMRLMKRKFNMQVEQRNINRIERARRKNK